MNVTAAVEDQSDTETRRSIMLAYQLFGYYWGLVSTVVVLSASAN